MCDAADPAFYSNCTEMGSELTACLIIMIIIIVIVIVIINLTLVDWAQMASTGNRTDNISL